MTQPHTGELLSKMISVVTDEMVQEACEVYGSVYVDDDKDMGDAMRAALEAVIPAQASPPPKLESELRRVLRVMKSANAKPPEKGMSIWDEDVTAVEEAADYLSSLSSADCGGGK